VKPDASLEPAATPAGPPMMPFTSTDGSLVMKTEPSARSPWKTAL
jgi:hypothetical protein